jgi:hypothetical protein
MCRSLYAVLPRDHEITSPGARTRSRAPVHPQTLQSNGDPLTRTTTAFHVLKVPVPVCKCLKLRFQAGSNPTLSASNSLKTNLQSRCWGAKGSSSCCQASRFRRRSQRMNHAAMSIPFSLLHRSAIQVRCGANISVSHQFLLPLEGALVSSSRERNVCRKSCHPTGPIPAAMPAGLSRRCCIPMAGRGSAGREKTGEYPILLLIEAP